MGIVVKEAVEIAGEIISGSAGAWSYTELAALLRYNGNYSTLEAAYNAVAQNPAYWYNRSAVFWAEQNPIRADVFRLLEGGAPQAVSSATETALEVAQGSSLTATDTVVKTTATSFTRKAVAGGAYEYGISGVMAMDVGIVGAAAAPVLGVALGAGLYELNPELWTKISQKLLPFCYPGTTKIPTWMDIAGSTYTVKVLKDVIDALQDLFEEENIPILDSSGGGYTSDLDTVTSQPIPKGPAIITSNRYKSGGKWRRQVAIVNTTVSIVGNAIRVLVTSKDTQQSVDWGTLTTYNEDDGTSTTSTLTTTTNTGYTYDGRTVRYNTTGITGWVGTSGVAEAVGSFITDISLSGLSASQLGPIAWTVTYGTQITASYPPGTSRWGGTYPTSIPLSDPIVVDDEGNVIDTVPISPPITIPSTWKPGLPAPSGDPEEQPDTDTIYNPGKQIQPYLLPFPTPDETPIPENTPAAPDDNPSDPTDPPTKLIDVVPAPPAPGGISPWPSMPSTPLAFSQGGGLVTVYHPTPAQLYSFEQWLWVTYADSTIDKIFNNPFDGIITLFELYCTPTDVGTQTIKSGFLDSEIDSAVISRYTEINCGTVGIPEQYGNYLDYSPYSKAHCYLPFIGVVELNVDDIVGHGVNITYRIDEYNGSCIAMITVARSTEVNGEDVSYSNTVYQFSGNCAVELPLAGGSQAAIRAGMMQASAYQNAAGISAGASLIGGLGSLLMGSIGGLISGIGSAASNYAYGQANALSNMLSGKSTVQKSGTFGSSYGAMGIKNPFITITRPKQIQVANYNQLYGYPAHKMVIVGDCTGFLRCREVHVISPTATDEEKSMIETLLKTGVYVTE